MGLATPKRAAIEVIVSPALASRIASRASSSVSPVWDPFLPRLHRRGMVDQVGAVGDPPEVLDRVIPKVGVGVVPRPEAGRLKRAERLQDQLRHADLGRLVVHAEGDAADSVDLQRLPARVLRLDHGRSTDGPVPAHAVRPVRKDVPEVIVHGSHLPPIQSHLLQRKLKQHKEMLADPEAYRMQQTIQGACVMPNWAANNSRPSPAGARPGSTPPWNQGDPPCSFPPWKPGPRQGWAAGWDRFGLLEHTLRTSPQVIEIK